MTGTNLIKKTEWIGGETINKVASTDTMKAAFYGMNHVYTMNFRCQLNSYGRFCSNISDSTDMFVPNKSQNEGICCVHYIKVVIETHGKAVP